MTWTVNETTTNQMADDWNELSPKVVLPAQKLLTGLGDSITENFSSFIYSFANSSNNTILIYNNQGVDGDTSAQVLARVNDVPDETNIVTLMCTTNDVSMGVSIADHRQNIIDIVTALREKNIEVIGILAPPRDNTNAEAITTNLYNQSDYITYKLLGVSCFNPWRLMVDPSDGSWLVDKSDDGIHPNANAEWEAGNILWEDYSTNNYALPPIAINSEGINNNCAMLNTFGATVKPVNWNLADSVVSSVVGSDSSVVGNTWDVNISNAYNDMTSERFNLVAGDVYLGVITYEHTVNSGNPKVSGYWESDQSKRRYIINTTNGLNYNVPKNTFVTFLTLNTSLPETNMRFRVKVEAGTWDMNIKLSEMQIFNITDLGWPYPLPDDAM